MKRVPVYDLAKAIYQQLRQYAEVIPDRFGYNINVYNDGVESGRLTMLCEEHLLLGDYVIFGSDQYSSKRYEMPRSFYLLAVPVDKMRTSSIQDLLDMNYQSREVARMVAPYDGVGLVSPFANRHKELKSVVDILAVANECGYCTEQHLHELVGTIVGFC